MSRGKNTGPAASCEGLMEEVIPVGPYRVWRIQIGVEKEPQKAVWRDREQI